MEPGMSPYVVEEFTIDLRVERDTLGALTSYVGRFAIRYDDVGYTRARGVVFAFIEERYSHVVVTGSQGSPNDDQITVYFDARPKPALSDTLAAQAADPRRI